MIRVLIVARSIIMQTGLETLLATDPSLDVIGCASKLTSDLVQQLQPDVILMEAEQLEGIDSMPIVLLLEDWQNQSALELLRAGVQAILSTEASTDEILSAVQAAAAGLYVLPPELMELLLSAPPTPTFAEPAMLTSREVEVLNMLAEGLGNKAIARRLTISEHTVKFHISSIFSKLNASSRTEAVILGAKQGLLLL
jgi:two-component system, NarL family, response regulator YdfI